MVLRLEPLNELRPDVGMCFLTCLSDRLSRSSQYSLKEDKYELAIRDLTDKLKEVRALVPSSLLHQSELGTGLHTGTLFTGLH